MTDLFVIGGGPAGLAAAIAARQRGMSVVVAEGAEPPSDKACGEGLMPGTLAALAELGVKIRSGAGYRFRGIRFLDKNAEVAAEFLQGPGLGLRRTVLHHWMIQRAEECGVQMLWRTPVTRISPEGVQLPGRTVAAKWIVGADGAGSRVRRWSGLEQATREKQRFAARRHYHALPWMEHCEIYWSGRAQAYVTAIGGDEICVVVVAEQAAGADFDLFLRNCPQLGSRLAKAEVSSRERGAVTMMHSLHAVHSGNVALIGDASGGVDAITGEGLRLAFRQAIALAEAMERGDLRLYARAHRELTRKPMLMGSVLLRLGNSERLRSRAIGMLAKRPQLFAHMLAVHSSDADWGEMLCAGAQLGWRLLTTE